MLITLLFVIIAIVSYALGALNGAILLSRFVFHKDVRKYGSGNAGMTNVLRSVGKLPALLTFIGDFLKCVIAVLLAGVILRLFGLSETIHAYSMVWKAAQLCAGTAAIGLSSALSGGLSCSIFLCSPITSERLGRASMRLASVTMKPPEISEISPISAHAEA